MSFQSIYLSHEGDLLNLTWNDTSPRYDPNANQSAWQWDDSTWILAASFIIFTMQTGYKLGKVMLRFQVMIDN